MLHSWLLYHALAKQWDKQWHKATLLEAYSQHRREVSLALRTASGTFLTLHVRLQGVTPLVFAADGSHKARKNAAPVLASAWGSTLQAVEVPDRERMVDIVMQTGDRLRFVLFGPQANALWLNPSQEIQDAFLNAGSLVGRAAPAPRPTPWGPSEAALADVESPKALAKKWPLLGLELAQRVFFELTGASDPTAPVAPAELLRVGTDLLEQAQRSTEGFIYQTKWRPVAFSLLPLPHVEADVQSYPIDVAVRKYVRFSLSASAFETRYHRLQGTLSKEHQRAERSYARMAAELEQASRAETYERWGHLLMMQAHVQHTVPDEIRVSDVFEDPPRDVVIALDTRLNMRENATHYYDRAKRSRVQRTYAEERHADMRARLKQLAAAREQLGTATQLSDLDDWEKQFGTLIQHVQADTSGQPNEPFRRFHLGGSWQAWVGKGARQNDELTLKYAAKHDLWLHARGVAGSHVVIRVPGKNMTVPSPIVERAAELAAWYSKAKGQSLAPVMVVPRKHVRKVKGAPPGQVVVEREEVLLVVPRKEA